MVDSVGIPPVDATEPPTLDGVRRLDVVRIGVSGCRQDSASSPRADAASTWSFISVSLAGE